MYYTHAASPRKYNAIARVHVPGTSRAAESTAMGALPGAMGDRYLGPVPEEDLGPIPKSLGSLGTLRQSYFGGQDLSDSKFGGQNKDLGADMLSNNEKRLVMVGVIAMVGYFVFGDKIKKALKK